MIGYTFNDIKGINPSIYMHKIFLEDESKPTIEYQRRLNPNMKGLMCDASSYAIGTILGQCKDNKLHAIYYASRTMDKA